MPHQALKLIAGVDQNKTPALNEAAISQSQLVRFIPDRTLGGIVQKLGGWTKYFASPIESIVRALWAWQDTNANSYLAVGAEGLPAGGGGALQIIQSGGANDVTPQDLTVNIAPKFTTTAGSNVITVTDTGRNVNNYTSVVIQTQVAVGGIVLYGQYQCYNLGSSANQYQIYATDILGNPLPAVYTDSATALTVTNATGTGTEVTLTHTTSYEYPVGSVITVTGINPSAYNGTYVVTASTTTTVKYASTTTTAYSSGGSISNAGTVPYFTTTNNSDYVSVLLENHGYLVGDTFTVLVATVVGGVTIYGNYTVIGVTSANIFTISGSTTATSSTSGFENSGNVRLLYHVGLGPSTQGQGYGIGGYGLGGYGTGTDVTSSITGTPINTTDWTLDNWGSILMANPIGGPIYQWDQSQGHPIALAIANAPPVNNGMFVAMPQRQVVAWGSTFTGIVDPLLIRWSDVNNFDVWAPNITNQAGSYRIPKGSKIVQCLQGPQQGLIWTDLGVWAMQYSGPPYVYQFNEIGTGCGLVGEKAAATMNGITYWMSQSQFYQMSGSGIVPIKCPVWDVVFQDLDTTNLDKIRIAPNSRFGEITWYFPTTANNGENDGYVKYNVVLDQWDYGFNTTANPYVSRSAWINQSVLGPPIGSGLNTYIYQHETSTDADDQPMNSYFQTGYFVLTEADVLTFIDQVWPDMKWGYYGGSQGANILLTFYVTQYPTQQPTAYGPYTLTDAITYITPRFRGRLVSIRIESNDSGSWWRLGNIRYRLAPDGRF